MLASGKPEDGALTVHADARVLGAPVRAGGVIELPVDPERHLYLVPSGKIRVNGVAAGARDGIAIRGEERLHIEAEEDAELVLVDAA